VEVVLVGHCDCLGLVDVGVQINKHSHIVDERSSDP
jgi:hypothetical protein